MKKPVESDVEKTTRPLPIYAGDVQRTCSNCQHLDPIETKPRSKTYRCHNGISGRMTTRRIDGCAYGFYPSIEKFPLKAGPGGSR
jgi:hypothetical protein